MSSPAPKKKRKRNDVESNDRGTKGLLGEYKQKLHVKDHPAKRSKGATKAKSKTKEDEGTMYTAEEAEERIDPKGYNEIPIGIDLGCTFTGMNVLCFLGDI